MYDGLLLLLKPDRVPMNNIYTYNAIFKRKKEKKYTKHRVNCRVRAPLIISTFFQLSNDYEYIRSGVCVCVAKAAWPVCELI